MPREKDILRLLQNYNKLFPSDLSNVLVLNYLSGMEDNKIIYQTSLKARVQKLYCCMYVWRHWLKEVSYVLQMKPYCQGECNHEGSRICSKSSLAVFSLTSFKKKISDLSSDLYECSQKLISTLSAIPLSDSDVKDINLLLKDLSDFVSHMQKDCVTSCGVQIAFGFPSASDHASEFKESIVLESLKAIRVTCIDSIERLITSIPLPHLEGISSLEEFCAQNSSIIICTPSSSSLIKGILKSNSVDIVLSDDSTRITEPDMLIPMSIARRHVMLFGDHHLGKLFR